MRRLSLLLVAILLATGPTARAAVAPPPSADEIRQGKRLAEQLEKRYPVVKDPALNERLQRIAAAIVPVADRPGVTYVFKILDVDVANAVSLPGGWIYVTKPMFGQVRSDHELAALIAHEVAHVAHAHALEMQRRATQATLITILVAALTRNPTAAQGVQLAAGGILAHFTRDLERDADLTAIGYLHKTPYSPVGLLTLMEMFARMEQYTASVDPGAYADHPKTPERVAYIEADLRRRGTPIIRRIPANYLRLSIRDVTDRERPAAELVVNDRAILRLPDADRLREAAAHLDRLFNADVRSFEVGVRQVGATWTVVVRGTTVITLTPRDAEWHGTTVRDLAEGVFARLRAAMEDDLRRRKLTG